MAFVFFIYGLAFFILGIAIFILPRKDSAFKFAKSLWLIGSFGILHGINEWIDMFIFIHKSPELLALKAVRAFVMPLSFIFLIWFGTKVIAKAKKEFAWVKGLTFVLPIAWLCVFIFAKDHFLYGDIWARYLLCFPGALLTAWGLLLQLPDFKNIEFAPVRIGLKISALFFILYAIAAGTITPASAGFFLGVFGFPIQVLRAACAIMIAISMWRILVVFDWETKNKLKVSIDQLQSVNQELRASQEEIKAANELLIPMNEQLKLTGERLQREKGFSKIIAENIQEGIMLLSADFKILWANKNIIGFTGLKEDDILGNYCYKITHHSDEPCKEPFDICPLVEVFRTGKPAAVVHTHFDKEGKKLHVEVSVYPVNNERGEVVQLVHVTRDMTERLELEEQLRKKIDDLKRFNNLIVGRELKM